MPRLDDQTAERVQAGAENADSGEREPLEEGFYKVVLREVKVNILEKSKEPKLVGCPRWVWEFEIPEGEEHAGRRFWLSLILPADNGYQHADFMLSKFANPFDAYGVPINTDTNDLVGKPVRAFVVQRTINAGPNQGKLRNEVEELLPLEDGSTPVVASDDEDYKF